MRWIDPALGRSVLLWVDREWLLVDQDKTGFELVLVGLRGEPVDEPIHVLN